MTYVQRVVYLNYSIFNQILCFSFKGTELLPQTEIFKYYMFGTRCRWPFIFLNLNLFRSKSLV